MSHECLLLAKESKLCSSSGSEVCDHKNEFHQAQPSVSSQLKFTITASIQPSIFHSVWLWDFSLSYHNLTSLVLLTLLTILG